MRRTLVALACYFTLVHATVVAWATVHPVVMQADGAASTVVICYGNPGRAPDGAKGGAIKLSCAICAATAALTGTTAVPLEVHYSPIARRAVYREGGSSLSPKFTSRSGLSRAPPLAA